MEDSTVLALTPAVVAKCISIRRCRKIKTSDAIMAATAIVHKLTPITSDSDFNNIAGLQVFNPHSF